MCQHLEREGQGRALQRPVPDRRQNRAGGRARFISSVLAGRCRPLITQCYHAATRSRRKQVALYGLRNDEVSMPPITYSQLYYAAFGSFHVKFSSTSLGTDFMSLRVRLVISSADRPSSEQ